jgi:Asp-tRNA(Asn)/Glu-tRNA(Gln) amidotransferase A subunit family amidase
MANVDVIGLTAERAAAMLRAGECSSEELAGAYLERIEANTRWQQRAPKTRAATLA